MHFIYKRRSDKDVSTSLFSSSFFQLFNTQIKFGWSLLKGLKFIGLLVVLGSLCYNSDAQYLKVDGNPADWGTVFSNPAVTVKNKLTDPVNSSLDNIWTQGSSAVNPISTWRWTQKSPNDKGDIQNAGIALVGDTVFFFADRHSNNGDEAIGIWIFVNPVSLNADGTFSGVHTNGDILITSHFVNGGGEVDRKAYMWIDGVLVEIPLLDKDLSTRTNAIVYPSPAAWGYAPKKSNGPAGFYPIRTFFEGYINLAAFSDMSNFNVCYSSFLIETRNSQSLTASLEDLVSGAFQTQSLVTLADQTVCAGQAATFTAFPTGNAPFTFYWSLNGGTFAVGNNTYTIDPATNSGTVSVYVVGNSGCISDTITANLIVNPLPACSITGSNNVCPGSTNSYNGPAGMASYAWSVTSGSATISGSNSGQSVSVTAPASCGSYTLQLTVTQNGCTSTCSETFNATDAIAPVFTTCPADQNLGCNPGSFPSATPVATDNCGTANITGGTLGDPVNTGGCTYTRSRTWTATDACGNTATCTQTFTYTLDTEAPVVTATGTTLTLGCNPSEADINAALGTATATDNCGPVTATPTDGQVMVDGCTYSQTRSWSATDGCGNTGTASRTVSWTVDTEAPVVTATGTTLTLGCNPSEADINAALGTATATDNCGPVTATPTDGQVMVDGCMRSQTRSWSATDGCGNTGTASRTVSWTVDTEAPVVTATGTTLTLGCNPSEADINAALGTATATDNCGPVTATPTDGQVMVDGCTYSQTRSWSATDGCGNTGTASRTVSWTVDTEAPVVTATGTTLSLGCNPSEADINAALGTATATDNCGPVTATPTNGQVMIAGCTYSQTRSWSATDGCGNTGTASRTVSWTVDTEAPVVTATGTTLTLGCNPSEADINAALGTATATDNCGPVTATPTDGQVMVDGCMRSQTRNWSATDGCGNTGTASRTVSWTVDTEAPVVTATGTTLTLGCNPSEADINAALGTATATDNCGPVTATPTDGQVMVDGCMRSQTRNWSATDGCGNTGTASRTVSWTVDTEAPVVTATGTTLTLGCNPSEADINAALGTATATDNCGPVTATPTDGQVMIDGCTYSQTRSWSATDGCGNTGTASRTVSWTVDTEAPVVTATGTTLTLGCNPSEADINAALGTATATDNCGPVTATPTDGQVMIDGCTYSQTRSWSATDGCGNTGTASRTVSWTVDTEAPVVTATGTTLTLGCNPSEADINAALGTATATDNCGPVTATPTDGQVMIDGCTYSQTRSWSATDGCGNTGTASRTVSWTVDTEAPVVTATGTTLTLGCNPSEADINAALGTATATDNCGPVTATPTDGQVMVDGCTYSQTRSWSATDGCGNTGTASRTVSWTVDTEAPVVTATGTTLTLGCNPSEADINAALGTATATDNCGPVTATPTDGQVMVDGCTYSQTRSWSATDGCGNTGTASRTVSWTVDTEAPVVTATGTTLTLGCNPSEADINAALGTATATDNCGPVTATPTDGQVMIDGCTYSQTRSWSATDGCGNTGTASRTVSWTVDTEAPVVTATGTTLTLGCNPSEADINAALGTATATDNCGPVTATPTDGQVMVDGCTYSQTRSWSATDGCGNTGTASRTVSWTVDTEAPVVTATGTTLTLGCNPSEADINAALGTATATDNCGPVTATPTDGQVMIDGCTYSQTRSWSATDGCGNTGTASRTVSWTVDTEAPVVTATGTTLTLGCNPSEADINAALGTATATDNCGPVTATPTDGQVMIDGCTYSQTRSWSATDGCGNTGTASRTVSWTVDTEAPVVTATGTTLTLGCNPSEADINAALGTATATDNCGPVIATPTDGQVMIDGCTYSQTRSWSATDGCGNTGTASRTVSWTVDTEAPVVTATGTTLTLGCNPSEADINAALGTATATDNCGPVTATPTDGQVMIDGCMRSQTRSWSATDGCGNTGMATRTVTWIFDMTPPGFSSMPEDIDLECDATVPEMPIITGTDNCNGNVTITTNETDVTADCATGFNRIITRTWTATDACNNTSTHTQVIRIKCCPIVCTYTQGYFGNDGGKACNGEDGSDGPNTFSTYETIQNSINAQGGTITIGKMGGSNVTVTSSAADINAVIDILPGGGGSYAFTHTGSAGITALPSTYLKNGRINNTLFAQTLTLSINMGITETLADVAILPGMYLVTAESVECGSLTARDCEYEWNGTDWVLTNTPFQTYGPLSQALYDALNTKNVAGLLELANNALGGDPLPTGVTLEMIADAVDMINNAFDECKLYRGWRESDDVNDLCTPPAQTPDVVNSPANGSSRSLGISNTKGQTAKDLQVTAFPNPFPVNGTFFLRIRSAESGSATIEFFNANGSKVSQTNRMLRANATETVTFNGGNTLNGIIMYKVSVNGKFEKGMVMRMN